MDVNLNPENLENAMEIAWRGSEEPAFSEGLPQDIPPNRVGTLDGEPRISAQIACAEVADKRPSKSCALRKAAKIGPKPVAESPQKEKALEICFRS